MPELTFTHYAVLVAALLVSFVLGWVLRSNRSTREKMSISAGWQAQIDSQQSEHDRLADQNKSLMEQISQYQASNTDAKNRAKELSDSLKEAFQRRDELQLQLKDIRGNLEVAVAQRDRLRSSADSTANRDEATAQAVADRDARIAKLSKDLSNWQDRVPPLVERFRQRDLEAQQLEVELDVANDRIATLEGMSRGEHTTIEPVDSSNLPDGLDASNEAHTSTSILPDRILQDQIDAEEDEVAQETDAESHEEMLPAEDLVDSDGSLDAEHGDDSNEPRDNPAETEQDDADDKNPWDAVVGLDDPDDDADDDAPAAEAFPNVLGDEDATGIREADDLKHIKGIGPAIEKTLNDLGIFRFNQIAEMSEYEIDRVAQQLKGFRSRIYREDWIGQARTLQYQKNHDQ